MGEGQDIRKVLLGGNFVFIALAGAADRLKTEDALGSSRTVKYFLETKSLVKIL